MKIGAIVLAAGESKRFGRYNKLLAEIDGRPMIVRVLDAVIASDVSEVVVVTGSQSSDIEYCLNGYEIRFTRNCRYEDGMGSSLARGAESISDRDWDGIMVVLGDLPYLAAETVRLIIDAFRARGGGMIVAPARIGRRGHPVLFPGRYRESLASLGGDRGARDLIRQEKDRVYTLAVDDEGIHRDVDRSD